MKKIYIPIFLVALLVGCTAMSYRYYYLAPLPGEQLRGTLQGPKTADDLPLSVCQPDDFIKGKCVVLLVDEWAKVQRDGLDCSTQLKACQDGK